MTIKSDKWIRRMAEQHGLIEPFEPGQIRQVDGRRVISYGTSSYGYDIRCAPEFKVFTNIHSTVVDPKNFDEKSFVDFHDDVCIIPPNSFALARTLEYFRIPRNVLTICLGKSTYARCGIIVNVTPFEPGQVREVEGRRVISYGTSSYGYDIRCAPEFKVFTNIHSTVVDPKNFDEKSFVDFHGDSCIIPPNSFALARTVEYFRIPRNVLTICLGKSTYARCGIIVNVTPFEPEWEGYVTLEFSNTTPLPAKIYAGEGCAQVLFFESDEECAVSYKDRGGKYQGQHGVTLPKA